MLRSFRLRYMLAMSMSVGIAHAQSAPEVMEPHYRDLLERLVDINTETRNLTGLAKARGILIPEFERLGLVTTRYRTGAQGHEVLSFEVPNGDPKLLLIGHLDTVFPVSSPFQRLQQQGSRLTGPGAIDMKGGLVLVLNVLADLRDSGLLEKVRVVVNDDEEIGSIYSRATLRKLASGLPYGLVFEPGLDNGAVVTSQAGVRWVKLSVTGKAAHAGLEPEKGIDSCLDLAVKVQRVAALAHPTNGLTINPGVIEGGTKPNVVCDKASVTLDIRFHALADWRNLTAAIGRIAAHSDVFNAGLGLGTRTDYTQLADMDLLPATQTAKLTQKIQDAASSLGQKLQARAVGYGSDGNNLVETGMQLLVGLGPYGGGMHSDREFMLLSSYSERHAL